MSPENHIHEEAGSNSLEWEKLQANVAVSSEDYHPLIQEHINRITEERKATVPQPTDMQDRLDAIMKSYEALADKYEVIPISDMGYVVRLTENKVAAGNDWVLSDLDDTLIPYSGAKKGRLQNYEQYIAERNLPITPDLGKRIMNLTDEFARWDEGGENTYHIDAHIATLTWFTKQFKDAPPEAIDDVFQTCADTLSRIKLSQQSAAVAEQDDPFRFDNGAFLAGEYDNDPEIYQEVFNAMISPGTYDDAIDALVDIASQERDESVRINLGILTYGEPHFQLLKVMELIAKQAEAGHPLNVSQIWLTQVRKGKFIEELASSAQPDIRQEVFNESPHTILLVDDSPKELDDFATSKKTIYDKTGAYLARVRTVRQGTKNEPSSWGKEGDRLYENIGIGVHDPSVNGAKSLGTTLYTYLANNLSRAAQKRFEAGKLDDATIDQVSARVNYYSVKARQGNLKHLPIANLPPAS